MNRSRKKSISRKKKVISHINNIEQIKNYPKKSLLKKWGKYLTPAFNELYNHGIIAFIYPTDSLSTSNASINAKKNIFSNSKILQHLNKYWKMNISSKNEKSWWFEYATKVPHIWYVGDRIKESNNEIYLRYNLVTNEQINIVNRIFRKFFGKKFIWNNKKNEVMLIKFTNKPTKKKWDLLDYFITKLKKDGGFKIKIIKRGRKDVLPHSSLAISYLKYTGSTIKLINLIEKYGFKEANGDGLIGIDEAMIDPNKKILFVNISIMVGKSLVANLFKDIDLSLV